MRPAAKQARNGSTVEDLLNAGFLEAELLGDCRLRPRSAIQQAIEAPNDLGRG
jgi:hypothetical protein